MSAKTTLPASRARQIIDTAPKRRVLVLGDVMLDHFMRGRSYRISPEAPVPIIEFDNEDFMPGGAANVARNIAALGGKTSILGIVGKDEASEQLRRILREQGIGCEGLVTDESRSTSVKTRIVAQKQQVVRIDRESKVPIDAGLENLLLASFVSGLDQTDAVIIGDYGKGVVTQRLLDSIKMLCRSRNIWLSMDPKPVHRLDLTGLSLITPNRNEALALANMPDKFSEQLTKEERTQLAGKLFMELNPSVLLITLGEQGMLLCQRNRKPFYIPTVAKEVFDVSGAGDTAIATFTLAMASGATPVEAAILSNHAAGIVVGKAGTAVTSPKELLKSLE